MAQLCVPRCEFQKWTSGKFVCDLYEKDLNYLKVEDSKLCLIRCLQCEKEEEEYNETNTIC